MKLILWKLGLREGNELLGDDLPVMCKCCTCVNIFCIFPCIQSLKETFQSRWHCPQLIDSKNVSRNIKVIDSMSY